MPILAGGLLVVPESLSRSLRELDTGPSIAYHEDIGTLMASWVDPDGTEWPLSSTSEDLGWFTLDGPSGWGSTPVELVVDPLPRGGEQVRYVRAKPRRIQWPLYVFGDTHQDFVTRYRRIMRAFTKTSQRGGPGWLRVSRPDGRYRQIACYYEQGFEGESGQNQTFARPVLQLYCPDGYWSGDRPTRAYREFAGGVGTVDPDDGGDGDGDGGSDTSSFYSPFMTVTSSRVVSGGGGDGGGDGGGGGGGSELPDGSTEILNGGDVDAWPTWVIRGPMTHMTAENLTVGSRFGLTYNLLDGQSITITTNRPTVRGPGDANLSKNIDWFAATGADLWPLADGVNKIRFQVDGAGPGTSVEMLFTPRFETA